jgi:diketogulonate reductase-like aldo/keto reductase
MQKRAFDSTRVELPIIGQGTWQIATGGRRAAVAALAKGIELGMTHLDTAEMYQGAESIIAEAIAARRDAVYIVSKVLPQNASRRGTITACERSLARLGIERLDCYLLHWRGRHPLEETIAAFEELEEQGKIGAWGVSNFDVPDLDEVVGMAGEGRPACNQVLYHLHERAIEHAVLPWCEKHGVALVGYTPFGHGSFPRPDSAEGRVLHAIAAAHGATARQVILAFLVRRAPLFAIPKASRAEHATENARAGDLRLTDDEIARIDHAFPRGPRPRSLPTA